MEQHLAAWSGFVVLMFGLALIALRTILGIYRPDLAANMSRTPDYTPPGRLVETNVVGLCVMALGTILLLAGLFI